jgi:uncharacterized protein YkwD
MGAPMYKCIKSTAYKSKLILVVVVLLFSAQLHAEFLDRDLFAPPAKPVKPETVDSNIVVRQRVVDIRYDVISKDQGGAAYIYLNLFDDKRYTAIRMHVDHGFPGVGDAIWAGYIEGVAGSQVILSRKGNRLSGSVRLRDEYYLIRNFGDGLHVVREIDSHALHERSPQDSTNGIGSDTPLQPSPRAILQAKAIEQQVVNLVNQERATRDLHLLTLDGMLTASARGHSQAMAASNFFSHTGADGSNAGERMEAEGYNWNAWGENIAAYSAPDTAQRVMNSWMNSSGHRANILSPIFCDIGVGHVGNARASGAQWDTYWTQNFGRRQGVTVCNAPPPDPAQDPNPDADLDSEPNGSLGNGETKRFSLARNETEEFSLDIPSNTRALFVRLAGAGDADLYVKRSEIDWPADQGPHNQTVFKAPYADRTSNEQVVIWRPAQGRWNILIHGYSAADVSLTTSWKKRRESRQSRR